MMLASFNGKTAKYRQVTGFVRRDAKLRVPNDGRVYWQIKHAWDLPPDQDAAKQEKNAMPHMVDAKWGIERIDSRTGRKYDYVIMEDRWLWFIWEFLDCASGYLLPRGRIEYFYKRPGNYRTFAYATPGSLTALYIKVLEAHIALSEGGSIEGGSRDPVTGRNMTAKNNVSVLLANCGGNVVIQRRERGSMLDFEAINLYGPCPSVESVFEDGRYYWLNEINTYGGQRKVSNFPQIENAFELLNPPLPVAGTPFPLFAMGDTMSIRKSNCIKLSPGQSYSIYVPEV